MANRLFVGIGGGSGSGKSRLARDLVELLGTERSCLVEMDWYYRDLSALPAAERDSVDFDRPEALEIELLERQLDDLRSGQTIDAPVYAFSKRRRLARTRRVEPAPFIFVEGLFALAIPALRDRFSCSAFVEAPADIRLIRRIRRDLSQRGYPLETILQAWERHVRPTDAELVQPSAAWATHVWKSAEEPAFVAALAADLESRLASHAKEDTSIG